MPERTGLMERIQKEMTGGEREGRKPRIKDLPPSERPYELLEEKGAQTLTDAQLLAVLLQSGTVGETSVEMALRLLSQCSGEGSDPLVRLCSLRLEELRAFKGMGRVKAIKVKAAFELAVRLSNRQVSSHIRLNTPEDLADRYMEQMRYLKEERTRVVYLNAKMELAGDVELGTGTLTQSLVDTRQIFLNGFSRGAFAFVLLHNHPSGDPAPSEEDAVLTRHLKKMGKIMGLPLVDHIVIGDKCYYSFAQGESGILQEDSGEGEDE